MALGTGTISMSDVNTELGLTSSAAISLNDTAVRGLAGVASGTISMDDLRGKANKFTKSISTNQQELNLRTWAINNGWNGSTAAEITIDTGIYIWSDNTATPGLTINGSWPSGVTLINKGYIIGKGGAGGNNGTLQPPGFAGGPALSLGVNVSIDNRGYIAGGGGGGGSTKSTAFGGGGGGAGGGKGGYDSAGGTTPTGGGGGNPGSKGSDGTDQNSYYGNYSAIQTYGTGGGGGRILPGAAASAVTATGVYNSSSQVYLGHTNGLGGDAGGSGGAGFLANGSGSAISGAGGGSNNAGSNAPNSGGNGGSNTGGGGGGGWGASGGRGTVNAQNYSLGGLGGAAVLYNGYTLSWIAYGTIYGSY